MKRLFLTSICLLAAGFLAFGQSAGEIAAAKSIAKQYGYTEDEINKVMGHQIGQTTTPVLVGENVPGNIYGENPNLITPAIAAVPAEPAPKDSIYGHGFFKSQGLGIIPSYNAPVPESFVLGPGDEIVVNIWGSTSTSISGVVGKNGSVVLAEAGPVSVGGMTLGAAEKLIKSRLSRIYGGLSGGGSKMQLTLGRIKGVSVNVLGEVATPGVYNLPSLSTIPSAIFMAGGLSEIGTLRNITLYRGGKAVGSFDLYDYVVNGNYGANCSLQENDIISVLPAEAVVTVNGAVRRPLKYELKDGETVADLIKYAGGFSSVADKSKAHVDRTVGSTTLSYDIASSEFVNFKLADLDIVTFYRNVEPKIENRVTVEGAVLHAGPYAISENLRTVADLVKAAGGLKDGTYMDRAILRRYDDEGTRFVLQFNVNDMLSGKNNIALQEGDRVHFYLMKNMVEDKTVSISGEVLQPGIFNYGDGITLGDLIIMGGGFSDGAALTNIEIASRGTEKAGKVIFVNLEKNPEATEMKLQPFDQVSVRRLTYYRPQTAITIQGEVMYPGSYVIESSQVRLSDIISRAGGFTPDAFSTGARLVRTMTDDERERLEMAFEIAKKQVGRDSLKMEDFGLDERTFTVGIDLPGAMASKGSADDITLRNGDVVIIPQMNNTVKISGGVLYPNVVAFNSNYNLKDYISQAGGFTSLARRGKTYAVYMNGTAAARGSKQFHMEPGMEIVVPEKDPEQKKGLSAVELSAIASSATSLTTMVMYLVRMFQ